MTVRITAYSPSVAVIAQHFLLMLVHQTVTLRKCVLIRWASVPVGDTQIVFSASQTLFIVNCIITLDTFIT